MLTNRRNGSHIAKLGPDGEAWPGLARIGMMGILFYLGCLHAGCLHAPPLPIDEDWVVQQVSARYPEFFPVSAQTQAVSPSGGAPGLLRPRFGLPEIVQAGTQFSIELLERGDPQQLSAVALLRPEVPTAAAASCLRGAAVPGCYLLPAELVARTQSPETGLIHAHYNVRLDSAMLPPPGGYDLVVSGSRPGGILGAAGGPGAISARAPRAVWLRADDPTALSEVRVAHLSDLHIGKGGQPKSAQILAHLRQVIDNVNQLHPDLIIVTGDIVNSGQTTQLWPIAQRLLGELAAPMLIVLGNHDIEFMQRGFRPVRRYGAGWANFARTFHPFLHFSLSLGGYDFVGFDSGPAERTPRILTRGLHPSSVALLNSDILSAQERGQRGVVLFSHAPSRASTFNRVAPRSAGFFGRMYYGNTAFERMLIDAAARGQQVLHLAGHTHWSDVFELEPSTRQFRRWPLEALSPCPRPLRSNVALITTQAAGHSGLFSKVNARGYGFSLLTLGGAHPEIEVFRYGTRAPTQCGHNLQQRLADTSVNGTITAANL